MQLTPTPPLNTIITAWSGDVVGYYSNGRGGDDQGIELETKSSYTENIIWYKDLGTGLLIYKRSECPFPIGPGWSLRSSTNAAPILRVINSKLKY